jgi:GntR family transcriptional regulator
MVARLPSRSSPLEDQVVEILLERIASGEYAASSRLPSEAEFAEELNVSRATVRGALSTLEANGVVKRVHGVGTFVRQAQRIANPLNEVVDYQELITGQGYAFSFHHISAAIKTPSTEVATALQLLQEDQILEVVKAFTADGELLVYTRNRLPVWLFAGKISLEELVQPGATEPLFDFLEMRCGQRIEDYLATVRPEIAKKVKIEKHAPPVDPLTPVLVIEEVGYNTQGDPVIHETEYLFGDRMKFDLARRRRRITSRS